MQRRAFLSRLATATAAIAVVGPEALEQISRRRFWAGWGVGSTVYRANGAYHGDTAALQAILNRAAREGGVVRLTGDSGAPYRLDERVRVPDGAILELHNAHVRLEGDGGLHVQRGGLIRARGCLFELETERPLSETPGRVVVLSESRRDRGPWITLAGERL